MGVYGSPMIKPIGETMNVQLYHVFAARAYVSGGIDGPLSDLPEPSSHIVEVLGIMVDVPPNRSLVVLLIAAAIVLDVIELVPVLRMRRILPNRLANAGLLPLHRLRPALVPDAFGGHPFC